MDLEPDLADTSKIGCVFIMLITMVLLSLYVLKACQESSALQQYNDCLTHHAAKDCSSDLE